MVAGGFPALPARTVRSWATAYGNSNMPLIHHSTSFYEWFGALLKAVVHVNAVALNAGSHPAVAAYWQRSHDSRVPTSMVQLYHRISKLDIDAMDTHLSFAITVAGMLRIAGMEPAAGSTPEGAQAYQQLTRQAWRCPHVQAFAVDNIQLLARQQARTEEEQQVAADTIGYSASLLSRAMGYAEARFSPQLLQQMLRPEGLLSVLQRLAAPHSTVTVPTAVDCANLLAMTRCEHETRPGAARPSQLLSQAERQASVTALLTLLGTVGAVGQVAELKDSSRERAWRRAALLGATPVLFWLKIPAVTSLSYACWDNARAAHARKGSCRSRETGSWSASGCSVMDHPAHWQP